jgi:hypothetical protein
MPSTKEEIGILVVATEREDVVGTISGSHPGNARVERRAEGPDKVVDEPTRGRLATIVAVQEKIPPVREL